ncbi:CRISPR-associated endoribonuclease Cas6 [Metallosphaera tengchongensis]|uniref:CRISPR-associated endoribonuclease Cas6 n=1 Tax=Metallosphaera tengchongensis TaxID=1532350 RepID=A0A6N0NY24_9CREN|nr:CRISPR-associated endoribonuclease Cas6 [Metallosphaera tengchongensis]QKR00763.1 CRISPR-associated endoribonuclease Cas6 [Metallosphaera tengchongensis]
MIFKIDFKVTSDHDVFLPPFPSKLSRLVLTRLYPSYSKLQEAGTPYKPLRVTTIKDSRGSPLYAVGGRKVIMKKGEGYSFSFTFLDPKVFEEIVSNPDAEVQEWDTRFHVSMKDAQVVEDFKGIGDTRLFKVEFLTPTSLQPIRPNFKRKDNRYVLFPYVPLLMHSLMKHWNQNMEEKVHSVAGVKALYYMREVDYWLRPVTTFYDGRPVRGFVGWTVFELRSRRYTRLTRAAKTLLEYANYFGVGKSRAIGFGEVRVSVMSDG